MKKVVLFVHVSLDGFMAGPNGELNWISYDAELERYAAGIVAEVGSPVYGRVTYQMMEGYWPTVLENPDAPVHARQHAEWVDNVEKIVFSRTLKAAGWKNTRLFNENIPEVVQKLKQEPGGNLVIFGSPRLAHSFMELDLIDEYQLTLNPVLLGAGIPLFSDIQQQTNLKLLKSTTLNSGVLGLHYERVAPV